MTDLYAFLHPESISNEKVIVSERFKDKDGNVVPFEIKAIMQDENDRLIRQYTKQKKNGESHFDRTGYGMALVAAAVVFPDLNSAELQKHYGVLGAERLPSAMLSSGEYGILLDAVRWLSGLDDNLEEDVEEAKNA